MRCPRARNVDIIEATGGMRVSESKRRIILHIDMNAFYCSVHAAEQPEVYKGKPTAVAGSVELRRGIA